VVVVEVPIWKKNRKYYSPPSLAKTIHLFILVVDVEPKKDHN